MLTVFDANDNITANCYWEAHLPNSYVKPVENSSSHTVESFIRDKYQRKAWIGHGPDPVTQAFLPKVPVKEAKTDVKVSVSKNDSPQFTTDLLTDNIFFQPISTSSKIPSDFNIFQNDPPVQEKYPIFTQPNPITIHQRPNTTQNHSIPVQDTLKTEEIPSKSLFEPREIINIQSNSSAFSNISKPKCNADTEKEKKISQVLSMYGKQQNNIDIVKSNAFQPLGAIAAQNFFNQVHHPKSSYPNF